MKSSIAAALITFVMTVAPASAQDIQFRLQHFLPADSNLHSDFLQPWAQRIQQDSGNRIRIEIVPQMQLGGKPEALIDQVRDGAVDMAVIRPGFTPDRFPKTEVFELPFLSATALQTSKAFWELYENSLTDEYRDYKILAAWVHGPSYLHVKGDGVRKISEMKGLKLGFPNRFANRAISRMGAIPVGLPPEAISAALTRGVIDGVVLPWEATQTGGIRDLVNTHTEFSGKGALTTSTFVLAMNKSKYDALPDDLKAVLDKHSGIIVSAEAGGVMDVGGAESRKSANSRKNEIIALDAAETERWQRVAGILEANWIAEMTKKGIDAKALVQAARDLVAKHSSR